MSREDRLARLGLLHLIDKPEELAKALAEGVQEHEDQAQAWIDEAERLGRQQELDKVKVAARPSTFAHRSLPELKARFHELDQMLAALAVDSTELPAAELAEYVALREEIARRSSTE